MENQRFLPSLFNSLYFEFQTLIFKLKQMLKSLFRSCMYHLFFSTTLFEVLFFAWKFNFSKIFEGNLIGNFEGSTSVSFLSRISFLFPHEVCCLTLLEPHLPSMWEPGIHLKGKAFSRCGSHLTGFTGLRVEFSSVSVCSWLFFNIFKLLMSLFSFCCKSTVIIAMEK